MHSLTILDQPINVIDGLYSLNDLHKASGGANKHKPTYFLQNQETQDLISEINKQNYAVGIPTSKNFAVMVIKGKGKKQGTYVCKELVYRYAMWISPKFSLAVIRTFDRLAQNKGFNENYQLLDEYNKASLLLNKVEEMASNAGRTLSVTGKQIKPKIKARVTMLEAQIQLVLPVVGE